MDDLMKKLTAPFPVAHLRWRMGNRPHQVGREWRVRLLAYIEKSHVERRLDEVFGPMGWENSYRTEGVRCTCIIAATIGNGWTSKEDGSDVTDYLADAKDMRAKGKPPVDPVKAVYSDAFKRAGMKWGIGRYLNALKLGEVILQSGWGQAAGAINTKAGDQWMHALPPSILPGFATPEPTDA